MLILSWNIVIWLINLQDVALIGKLSI